jgi:cytochrome c556
MEHMKRTIKMLIQFTFIAIFLPSMVSADDQSVIEYREHIMKTLDEQSAAVGMILSMAAPNDNTVAHLQAIALTAQIALKAFEPKVPGGEAKPEVWSNWADFSKRMNEFAKKTAEVAKLVKEKGADDPGLGEQVVDALSCKACHDVYRKEKK